MQNASILKITGLHTNNNELSEVPQGSLADCNNVVLTKDSVLEPRRGFNFYGGPMGLSATNDVAKQLLVYKKCILRHFSSTLQFDNGSGVFTSFSGTYNQLQDDVRLKYVESNGNLYFTTSAGIKKISAFNIDELSAASGYITNAGGVKALDLTAQLNPQEGFFTQNSKVAYRLVWGKKDKNSNVILGTPSERVVVTNSGLLLLVKDFNNLLVNLDIAAADDPSDEFSDTDYLSTYKIPPNSSANATTLYTNLLGLANKLENDINTLGSPSFTRTVTDAEITASLGRIVFDSALPAWLTIGQTIKNEGFSGSFIELNGVFTIASFATTNVPNDTLEFELSGTVTALASATGTVRRHEFLAIEQPDAPSTPALVQEINALQTYYINIVNTLLAEPTSKINDPTIFSNNAATTSATVDLTFTIPEAIDTSYFYQIYRTAVVQAEGPVTLDDIDPGDEMGLVFEANPTSTDITNKEITIHDITPETFRGANLYTNPQSGEGILQANEVPPVALDIASFRGSTFYANTKTKYRLQINLLGVSNFTSGVSDLVITDGNTITTLVFQTPTQAETVYTATADVAGSLASTYAEISSTTTDYYFWYRVSGVGTDPALPNKTGIVVDILTNDSANDVALATRNKLNEYNDFIISGATDQIEILNTDSGVVNAPTAGTTGFGIVFIPGEGEDAPNGIVELSNAETPAQQVDETARSLVKVINQQVGGIIYASYLTGPDDVPGIILLESRNLANNNFYIYSTDSNILSSFNPTLKLGIGITNITATDPTVITTSVNHGYSTGDQVIITNTDSTPILDGVYTITVLTANTFSVDIETDVAGSTGQVALAQVSGDNEQYANRIYFSKFQQPEAVPIVNFIDVGPRASEIKRILPLRDGLFVFKEEGTYRISGESAITGFTAVLFDNTTTIKSPDSAVTGNNQIFYFSDQGVSVVTDTGSQIISKDIENELLPLVLSENFAAATFGVSYESDRAYILWTLQENSDTRAQIGYRYNFFTGTWTKWKIGKTCAVVNEDILYLGASDTNYTEKERKEFKRQDYCDRQYDKTIISNGVNGSIVNTGDIDNVNIGDVLFQEQYLTIYRFNQLLKKLDSDTGVDEQDYFSTLEATLGINLRNQLDNLANKLDNDVGVNDNTFLSSIATYGSTFQETQEAYNVIIDKLNNNPNVIFNNYLESTSTVEYEAIIIDKDQFNNTVTLNIELPLIEGPVIIFNKFEISALWNVQSFGDPELYKQVSEAKFVFQRTNFTNAKISFASDISNALDEIDFELYGNGTFGNDEMGETVFGGNGDRRPIRVFVPRNKQRCRFLQMKIEHNIAREKMALLGYSMVFKAYSTKAYKQ